MQAWFKSLSILTIGVGCLAAAQSKPLVKKLSRTRLQIGAVVLDTAKREVRMPAKVNMVDGLVELLACTSYGKTHESVFVVEAKPLHIHTALLLLGARAGKCPGEAQAKRVPDGERLTIWVEVKGKPPRRGEDFVWRTNAKRAMQHTSWVFTGSKIIDGQFIAEIDGSIVATYYDPLAIINNPLPTNADDELYFVNKQTVPPLGAKVALVFRLELRDAKKAK